MTGADHAPSPPDPVERLAAGIAGLQRAYEHANEVEFGLRRDHPLRGRLQRVQRDIDRRQDAMREMISFERATTLKGALAQVMLATADIDLAEDQADKPEVTAICARASRLLYSAAAALSEVVQPSAMLRAMAMPDYMDEVAALGVPTAARAA